MPEKLDIGGLQKMSDLIRCIKINAVLLAQK